MLPNAHPGRQARKRPYSFPCRGEKNETERQGSISLSCKPELDFTSLCLPTQFSLLQTTPPLRSVPGEQITYMYFTPQRKKIHKRKMTQIVKGLVWFISKNPGNSGGWRYSKASMQNQLGPELWCCAKCDNLTANSYSFCTSPVPSEAFRHKTIWISFMNPCYYTQLTSHHPFLTFFLFEQQKIGCKFSPDQKKKKKKSLSIVSFLRALPVQKLWGCKIKCLVSLDFVQCIS